MKGAPPCLEVNLSDNKCFVGFIFVRWRGTSDLAWMCMPAIVAIESFRAQTPR